MAACRAPVAEGRLEGRWWKVSYARMAKARASLAAAGTSKCDEEMTAMDGCWGCELNNANREIGVPRGAARSAVRWAMSRGLFAPPPETVSWWIFVLGRTKRFRASTIERAVKIVAARMRSFGFALKRRPTARIFFV